MKNAKVERVKCDLCGSTDYTLKITSIDYHFRLSDQSFQLVQCNNCGLVYLNPRPTQEQIAKFYPAGYHKKLGRIERAVINFFYSYRAKEILKNKKLTKGRILDVGCGGGGFLFSLREHGWDTYGIDVSEDAVRLARTSLRKNVFNCELKKCNFSASYFDVITLWHVLEHLSNPSSELLEIHRILKKDGRLVVCVPNINSFQFSVFRDKWFNLDVPRHLYHFSPKTLRAMVEKAGFEIIKFGVSVEFPIDWCKSTFMSENSKLLKISIIALLPFTILLFCFSTVSSIFGRGASLEIYCKKMIDS